MNRVPCGVFWNYRPFFSSYPASLLDRLVNHPIRLALPETKWSSLDLHCAHCNDLFDDNLSKECRTSRPPQGFFLLNIRARRDRKRVRFWKQALGDGTRWPKASALLRIHNENISSLSSDHETIDGSVAFDQPLSAISSHDFAYTTSFGICADIPYAAADP